MFATGDLAAFDFSGKELWHRNLAKEYGRFAIQWIYGSSPLLYGGKLFVQVLRSKPRGDNSGLASGNQADLGAFLLCIDPATGADVWRQARPTDALGESQEAYSSPIPCAGPGGPEILIVGGNYVTAHAAANGDELWRCGGLNVRNERSWRIVPSPVVANGVVVVCGPKRDPVLGVKDGGKGLVTETNIAWQFREFPSDCVTPLAYQDKLFVLDGDRQMLTCLDPKTGEKAWQGSLGVREIFRASPTGADGRIYCVSENGTAVVLDAGAAFKILATIPMGEGPVRASIAAAQGQLFLRTAKNLYCVGKP
jgi:outer membrane protein assembly factor BamB